MRSLLAALLVVGALFVLAPGAAHASEAHDDEAGHDAAMSFADFVSAMNAREARDASAPKGPIEQPADWIAVGGIICYAVLPVVFVVALGFVAYELWTRNADAALVGSAARSTWIYRGVARPPSGLVLLRF